MPPICHRRTPHPTRRHSHRCSGVVGCRGVTVAEADTITGIPTTIDPAIITRTGGDGDYYIPLLSSLIWSARLLLLIIDTRYLRHEIFVTPAPACLADHRHDCPGISVAGLWGCGVGSGPKDRAFPKGPLGPTTALMDIAKGYTTLIDLYNVAFLVACSGSLSYAGSITWCSGTDPCVGTASAARSLVGAAAGDKLRIGNGGESACPAFPPCDGWRARPWLTPLPIPHCVSACLCWPCRQLGDLGATLSTTVTLGPNATQPLYDLVRWSSSSTTASSMTICPTASGCAGVVTDPAVSLVGTSTMKFKGTIDFVPETDLIRFLPNGRPSPSPLPPWAAQMIQFDPLPAQCRHHAREDHTLCVPSAGCNGTLSAENTFGGNPGTHLTMPPAASPEYAASSFYGRPRRGRRAGRPAAVHLRLRQHGLLTAANSPWRRTTPQTGLPRPVHGAQRVLGGSRPGSETLSPSHLVPQERLKNCVIASFQMQQLVAFAQRERAASDAATRCRDTRGRLSVMAADLEERGKRPKRRSGPV
ncbi:hypothetical protein PAPYR_11731 [Paratrimastix pyriformis]|uniref:Uncharacterized protein n=1 Tax=Paratrimastix pyriformis TaxID=342808 RepID=A0ABQ8U789_9EUKA|nr:hypothetical protein PAPYR_11731 [Paratrimastix pyriformis]